MYLETFSFKGQQLKLTDCLIEKGIRSKEKLISKIAITMIDEKCNSIEKLNSHEFWSLENLIKTYCETQRREMHKTSQIIFNKRRIRDKTQSLYQLKINHGSTVQYFVPPYTIIIKESEDKAQDLQGFQLEIQDDWDVDKLMVAYSRETSKPFMDEDKVLLNGHILEGSVPIWKLRIVTGSELFIEREVQVKALPYYCAECGNEVMLKSQDAVQCRNCFCKILYKRRTTRACQYDCR